MEKAMETEYQRVRRLLEEQFQDAVKRRNAASARFDEIRSQSPSGLPHPDGAQRIANASAEYSAALKAVNHAVQRIADFQIHRIVPEDLRQDSDDWKYLENGL